MVKQRGFTLIELIIVIALTSVVLLAASNMLIFGMKAQNMVVDEYEIQSAMRIMSETVNNVTRDSSGAFLLHRDNANALSDGWNYIMLNEDATKLIEYVWDESKSQHTTQEIFSGIDGVSLDLTFSKATSPDEDKLVSYAIAIKRKNDQREIATTLESINALQVVDRAYGKVANAIAYRNDKRFTDIVSSQAAVAMVLDTSGSMDDGLDGKSSSNKNPKKLKLMKEEALRLIDNLAKNPNIYISLVPFSSTANSPKNMMNAQSEYSSFEDYFKSNAFKAEGGTNTGDGIRRAYYRIKDFNEEEKNSKLTNKNFMIILVDGVTTYGSVHNPYYYYDRYNHLHYDDKLIEFVTGNSNINDELYPTYGDFRSFSGRYAGYGNRLDPIGTQYVNKIGEMVKAYKKDTPEAIKVYVIGFSSVKADYGSLKDIALATSGDTKYYEAGDTATLNAIFSAIGKDISDALWQIGGPN